MQKIEFVFQCPKTQRINHAKAILQLFVNIQSHMKDHFQVTMIIVFVKELKIVKILDFLL